MARLVSGTLESQRESSSLPIYSPSGLSFVDKGPTSSATAAILALALAMVWCLFLVC